MRDESLAEDHKYNGDGKEKPEAKRDLFGVLIVVIVCSAIDLSQRNK